MMHPDIFPPEVTVTINRNDGYVGFAITTPTHGGNILLSYVGGGSVDEFRLTLKEAEQHAQNILKMVEQIRAKLEEDKANAER